MVEIPDISIYSAIAGLILFALGFLSREVLPWYLRAKLEEREERRQWYREVGENARRLRDVWRYKADYLDLDMETVEELSQIENELNQLMDPSMPVDEDIEADVRDLYDALNDVTRNSYLPSNPDESFLLDEDGTADGLMGDLVEGVKEVQSISDQLAEDAIQRSNSGLDIFGVKI